MTPNFPDIAILVPGTTLHSHAVSRIASEFRLVTIERPDASLITPEIASSVRGLSGAMIPIDAALIDALPNLEMIGFFGMGYDAVDAAHAAERGIMVTNTPNVMNEEVADATIGLLLMTIREFERAGAWLRDGRWIRDGHYRLSRGSLRGRRVGIFGLGRIGSAIARRLEAFGVEIAYHNRRPDAASRYTYHPSLLSLAEAVDTLISVAPGGPSTAKAINTDVLRALGPEGVFINVGRGSTVDDDALAAALADGTILAAGLDVFADEPHVPQKYLNLPNLTLLPHVASASEKTRKAVADLCVDNLVSWFSTGKPLTPVHETAHLAATRKFPDDVSS